jgi:hypothetical protein
VLPFIENQIRWSAIQTDDQDLLCHCFS